MGGLPVLLARAVLDLGRRFGDSPSLLLTWTAERLAGDGLRGLLETLVAGIDVELPHYPMVYGMDPSSTGGTTVAAKPGPSRIPAHGTDWVPVVRDGDTAKGLPLPALLSQVLMAFTIDYEERASFPMAVTSLLPAEPVRWPSCPASSTSPGRARRSSTARGSSTRRSARENALSAVLSSRGGVFTPAILGR